MNKTETLTELRYQYRQASYLRHFNVRHQTNLSRGGVSFSSKDANLLTRGAAIAEIDYIISNLGKQKAVGRYRSPNTWEKIGSANSIDETLLQIVSSLDYKYLSTAVWMMGQEALDTARLGDLNLKSQSSRGTMLSFPVVVVPPLKSNLIFGSFKSACCIYSDVEVIEQLGDGFVFNSALLVKVQDYDALKFYEFV